MTPPRALPTCSALWIGPTLGALERTCLSSFVETGHPVDLYAYDDLRGVPSGVAVRDAAEVLPRSALLRHRRTGSWSLGSNRFRYALMRAGRGVWIDCDVLCLRPLPDDPFLFGFENERRINGAVLRLPADAPVLRDLEAIFETPRWVPPWEPLGRRLRYAALHRLRRRFGLADMPWGVAGPNALTHYLVRRGVAGHAQPPEAFYPVRLRDADALLSPDPTGVASRIGERTSCIHLWSQALRAQQAPPPRGSFVAAVRDGSWREVLDGLFDPSPRAVAEARGRIGG